jgi:hypothetical protein
VFLLTSAYAITLGVHLLGSSRGCFCGPGADCRSLPSWLRSCYGALYLTLRRPRKPHQKSEIMLAFK